MIVLDTSVIVDSLLPKLGVRSQRAEKVLQLIKLRDFHVFAPKILKIELASVLSRKKSVELVKMVVEELVENIELFPEDELFDEAYDLSYKTGSRAVDLYFIATAKLTNSVLITNDKTMAKNAKKAGIEAYYLLEEYEEVMKRLSA